MGMGTWYGDVGMGTWYGDVVWGRGYGHVGMGLCSEVRRHKLAGIGVRA